MTDQEFEEWLAEFSSIPSDDFFDELALFEETQPED